MGSLRAKQGSYIEILKAIQLGQLQGLTRPDRLLASQIWNTLNKMEYDPDLKLYLPFDEASGATAHDLSGNANTGTATGTTIVDGVFGKARSFNGAGEGIMINNDASLQPGMSDWSVMFWMKRLGLGGVDYPIIISARPWLAGLDHGWAISVGASAFAGQICTHFADGLTGWDVGAAGGQSTSTSTLDTWCYWAVVFDRTVAKLRVFLNGVLDAEGSLTYPGSVVQTSDVYLGAIPSNARDLNAVVDGMCVYSRKVTADEIYLHYLAGALKLGLI